MAFGFTDLLGVAPMILLVVAALAVITLDIFLGRDDDREIMPMTSAGALIGVFVLLAMLWKKSGTSFTVFGGQLVIDRFGLIAAAMCTATALVTVLTAPRYLTRSRMEHGEFYGLTLFALVGMLLMCLGDDLMTVFLALETMSLAIYGLVGFNKRDPLGAEAAAKYFVMGAIGSGFFTFGIALLYAATGTTAIPELTAGLVDYWDSGSRFLALPGLAMMVVGFGFKLGAAPFHAWVPDVYQGAPTPVTGFMAAGVKVAAAALLARVLLGGFDFVPPGTEAAPGELPIAPWTPVLAGVALASLVFGVLTALVQQNVKRLLGFSAVAHTGFILFAFLGTPGIGAAARPLLVYLAAYAAATAGVFAVLAQLSRASGEDATDLAHLRGLGQKRPALAAALGLFMLSLAGVPGTAGFLGKLLVFREAISGHWYFATIFAILMSVVALAYYLPVIVAMYMHPAEQEFKDDERMWGADVAVGACALVTLWLGLWPQPFLDAAQYAAEQLRG